jgi:hypothetical protein
MVRAPLAPLLLWFVIPAFLIAAPLGCAAMRLASSADPLERAEGASRITAGAAGIGGTAAEMVAVAGPQGVALGTVITGGASVLAGIIVTLLGGIGKIKQQAKLLRAQRTAIREVNELPGTPPIREQVTSGTAVTAVEDALALEA